MSEENYILLDEVTTLRWSQPQPVIDSTVFRLRSRMRKEGTETPVVSVGLLCLDSAGKAISYHKSLHDALALTNTDFTSAEVEVSAADLPAGTASAILTLVLQNDAQLAITTLSVRDISQEAQAGLYASAALTSATNASASADDASAEAGIATQQRIDAETAAGAASVSRTDAATSETNAAGSASNAATSAGLASASENDAGISASSAAASASTATTKADEASQSASAANSAKIDAETAAGAASASEANAVSARNDAAGSASSSSTSAGNAATSETNAGASASAAAQSASGAASSADAAGQSATAANSAKIDAETAASNASTSEGNAATSETNAAGSAGSAATSASVAAEAEFNTQEITAAQFPADFSQGTRYWTDNPVGTLNQRLPDTADHVFYENPNHGPLVQINHAGLVHKFLSPKALLRPRSVIRRIRLTLEYRWINNGAGTAPPANISYVTLRHLDTLGAMLEQTSDQYLDYGMPQFEWRREVFEWDLPTDWVSAIPLWVKRDDFDHATFTEMREFRVEDVTEEYQAGQFAGASAQSASAAEAEASDAAQFAKAAQSSETNAATSEANAFTSEQNSSTAATNAAGSAASAETSAQTAAQISARGIGVLSSQFIPNGPTGWQIWQGTSSISFQPSSSYPTGQEVVFSPSSAQQVGLTVTSNNDLWAGAEGLQKYKIEMEIEWLSGDPAGAGILFDWRNTAGGNFREEIPLTEMVTDPFVAGGVQVASAVVRRPETFTGSFASHEIYILANFSALGGLTAKSFKVRRFQVFPLTVTEASVEEHSQSIATIEGNAAATYAIRLKAGGAANEVEFVAADDPVNGPNTGVKFTADEVLFDNTVKANHLDSGSIETRHLRVGTGFNLVPNADFGQGKAHWSIGDTPLGQAGVQAQSYTEIRTPGSAWTGANYPTLAIRQNGTNQDGYADLYVYSENGPNTTRAAIPVTPGQRYIASARLRIGRCTGQLLLAFYDRLGNQLIEDYVDLPEDMRWIYEPEKWLRFHVASVAPASAQYAGFTVRKNGPIGGADDSYIVLHQPMLEPANPNQTEPSSFSSGTGTIIDGGNIMADTLTVRRANIDTAAIGTAEIENGAVTNRYSASKSSWHYFGSNWSEVIRLNNIGFSGGPAFLACGGAVNQVDLAQMRIRVHNNTAGNTFNVETFENLTSRLAFAYYDDTGSLTSYLARPFGFGTTFSLGGSSYDFILEVKEDSNKSGSTARIKQTYMFVIETKR